MSATGRGTGGPMPIITAGFELEDEIRTGFERFERRMAARCRGYDPPAEINENGQ